MRPASRRAVTLASTKLWSWPLLLFSFSPAPLSLLLLLLPRKSGVCSFLPPPTNPAFVIKITIIQLTHSQPAARKQEQVLSFFFAFFFIFIFTIVKSSSFFIPLYTSLSVRHPLLRKGDEGHKKLVRVQFVGKTAHH